MNIKTINNIAKAYKLKEKGEKLPREALVGVLDQTNVLMYFPKTKEGQVLFELFGEDKKPQPVPNSVKIAEGYQKCRFSKEYVSLILKTLIDSGNGDTVTICIKEGYPLVIEDESDGFILAPRNNQDGDIHEWYDCELLD